MKWLKKESVTKSLSPRRYMWQHKAWRTVGLNILKSWSKNGVLEEEVHVQSTVSLTTVAFSLLSHLKYKESTVSQLNNLCTATAPWSGALLRSVDPHSRFIWNPNFHYGLHKRPWARSILRTTNQTIPLRSILILSYHLRLGLLSGLFASDFPIKNLHAPLLSKSLKSHIWQI